MLLFHFRSDFLERMFKPSERIDAEGFARADKGIEDSVVLGAPVVLAEQVVFAAKYGGSFEKIIRFLSRIHPYLNIFCKFGHYKADNF